MLTKLLSVLAVAGGVALAGVTTAHTSGDCDGGSCCALSAPPSCCYPGSPCCYPGSPCCDEGGTAAASCCPDGACCPDGPCCATKATAADKSDCCFPGSPCCAPGGACCGGK
ncbi:MAG TPA: hypothetical protein VGF55_33390 [Gemmataceae bacterium]|jgi:hypothetical protein